ncbi:cytochrome P450 [Tenggerimyces flavus]|uniref:Cytochrome P450 n=1 Tax=Tenggerimyces flavus TaxID=1708749 RepID=A0ABV7YAB2_9ACTN|nr:cytochrome P450 [Tenggerimyces flavus]MBM7785357.1 cytochrome P450 [Tenggerimyces flavus]
MPADVAFAITQLSSHDGPTYVPSHDAWFFSRYADVVAGLRAFRTQHLSSDLAAQAFVRFDTAALRNRVRHACEHALERVRNEHRLDVVRDYAAAVTSTVVPELFGISLPDRERFLQWCKAIHRTRQQIDGTRSIERVGAEAARELADYLLRLIADRRTEPRDDLLGALVAAAGDSGTDDIVDCVVSLAIAGTETTTDLLGLGVLALLESPEQFHLLRGSPDLAPAAVEELLRYCGPVRLTPRRAPSTMVVAGAQVAEGQLVMLGLAAANRDPAVFSAPDELDLMRTDNRHLTFGLGGLDRLGAPLVRLQAEIALQTLLRRLPYLELADNDHRYQDVPTLRGLRALPVVF